MSALSAEIERDRIKEAIKTIGTHIVSLYSLVSLSMVEVECGGKCKSTLEITSIGLDELVKRLAEDGWRVTHTDRMLCPICSGFNEPDYWKDQV